MFARNVAVSNGFQSMSRIRRFARPGTRRRRDDATTGLTTKTGFKKYDACVRADASDGAGDDAVARGCGWNDYARGAFTRETSVDAK
jgi:hypothetical protein